MSPATLNLERVFEQNRQRLQRKDGAKAPEPEPAAGLLAKGKPKLMLMGQRRYDSREAHS